MDQTPEEWLAELFEFEFCAECGGDAPDHEVCLVPGMRTYFARCLRPGGDDLADDDPRTTPAETRADPEQAGQGG